VIMTETPTNFIRVTEISGASFFEDNDPEFVFRDRGIINCALKRTGYHLN
jgi:hypothetical protein